MPRGSRHVETGRLNQQAGYFVLRRDGGGTWRLDMGWWNHIKARRMVGAMVVVDAERAEFDLLDVITLRLASELH